MKYELILVRYGEIALKKDNTRRHFEHRLVTNIHNALNINKIQHKIHTNRGRIYVTTDQIMTSISVLQKIFGVASVSPAIQTQSSMDKISDIVVKLSKEVLHEKVSFAIRATRTGNHNFSSQDVAIRLGNDIIKATHASVDLTQPDIEIFIEIRDNDAFVFTEKLPGVGGLPLGTQGTILALIKNHVSLLASWYLMRRGCKQIVVNTNPSTTPILKSFYKNWFTNPKIHVIEPDKNLYKKLNDICVKDKCDAIVTGHSLYSNDHTELSKLTSIINNISIPVLSPLIAMNKDEIEKKCREIGLKP